MLGPKLYRSLRVLPLDLGEELPPFVDFDSYTSSLSEEEEEEGFTKTFT